MAVSTDYVFVCNVNEVPSRGKKTVHINGTSVLLIACESGLHAIENACPHTGQPIGHGKVLNCEITSPHNGARYNLQTGKYVGGGLSPFQSHWLTVFPVAVEDDAVYVHMLHL